MMNKFTAETPADVTTAFELGYLAAISRLRRQLPPAWRAGALAALTESQLVSDLPGEPHQYGKRHMPHVQGFKLIVMRCESAATMLTWRKDLTPDQRERLGASISRLRDAAARLGVDRDAPSAR
jgi:hypothetical protein